MAARECPICGWEGERFERGGRNLRLDALCPKCRSLERQRLVWLYLLTETDLLSGPAPQRVLHIAPEPALSRRLAERPWVDQLTADLDPRDVMVRMDVTAIDYPDDSFDVVYASHVLEHVPDDAAAMRELHRVLRPSGWGILQVPISAPVTDEDPTITDPAERARRFGQDDHVRHYGPDYADRLARAGFQVTIDAYPHRIGIDRVARFGLTATEKLYLVGKRPGVAGAIRRRLQPAAPASARGYVEQVRDGVLQGWASRPGDSDERLTVQALVDGAPAGEARASLPRPSLASAGIGDGRHGFVLTLPPLGAGPHRLRVQTADGQALPPTTRFTAHDAAAWFVIDA